MLKYKYIFQIKYTAAILSASTRKLLRFEISEMLIAAFKQPICCVSYYNFWHTFVPYCYYYYYYFLSPPAQSRKQKN